MNDCELYQELISRMLDADLTAEEEAALKSHLDTCMECKMMYEAFTGISGMIAESLEEPPEALCENIMAEIRRSEIKKKNRRLRPILTAAACFAVVLLGVFGLKNTPFAVKGAAPMAMEQTAVSEDMAAAEAPAPAPAADAGQTSMFFAMAAPAEVFSAEAAEPEEAAYNGCAAEAEKGEEIIIADSETMDALRELLSGESAEAEQNCRLLYTVCCEEDGSSMQIFEHGGGTIIYTDSRDGGWYRSSCVKEICGNFLAELSEK